WHSRRLHWSQADDGAGDPRLFASDRIECVCVELALIRRPSLSGRRRDRLRVADWGFNHGGALARPGARSWRGTDALWIWHRLLLGIGGLGLCQRSWARCLALYVSDRRTPRPVHALGSERHSRIGNVAAESRTTASRFGADAARRWSRCDRLCA